MNNKRKNKIAKKLIISLLSINIFSFLFISNISIAKEINNKEVNKNDKKSNEIIKMQSKVLGISDFIKEADNYKIKDFDIDVNEIMSLAIK